MAKIRILFIQNSLVCGGKEQALFDLCNLLDQTKFEVTVMVQRPGAIWDQKFRDAGIKVIDVWDCQKKSRNPLVKISNYIKRKQLVHYLHNDSKGLIDACFRKEFDVIISYGVWHTHHLGLSRYAKTVKYIHEDVNTLESSKAAISEMLDILPKYNRIICVSQNNRISFQEFTGITENVETLWNPLNSDLVRKMAEEKVDAPSGMPVICAVGRLSKEKGFDRLIRIHKKILDMHIPHKLIIVGGGFEDEYLKQIIKETDTADSVIMAGYAPNPYPYMKNCTFMVCSSYSEGLPVIAMEGLSLGIPIVSAVPSIGELFGEEICGIVTENDDDSLMEGIVKMLTDHDFYSQSKAGAEARSAVFDGKAMVRKVEKVFIDLVESSK